MPRGFTEGCCGCLVAGIAEWIMPAVYAGHIDRVAWVRPPWAHQLPLGDYDVGVGKRKEGGRIAVDLPQPYYLEELLYAPASELENTK